MYFKPYLIETDTHCHTVASTHAYSTVVEMATYAAKAGLKAIAITDHGPKMTDGAHLWHFANLKCLPNYIEGVRVLHGVEANVIDLDGNIDMPEYYQRELDWVIASFHEPALGPADFEQCTNAYLSLAKNPYIDVIGHSGTDFYAYDYEKAIPVFGENGKIVEINSHSFECRKGAAENCRRIAEICKKNNVQIVVNSDSHVCFSVGDFKNALEMLASIDFPPELIVNRSLESLAEYIGKKRNRDVLK